MYCHCITIANINQEQWRRACRPVAWSPGNEKHACMKNPGYTRNVCPGGRWQRPRGFTLIEMMVVVALVAILAALAAPSFIAQIANQRVRADRKSTRLNSSHSQISYAVFCLKKKKKKNNHIKLRQTLSDEILTKR